MIAKWWVHDHWWWGLLNRNGRFDNTIVKALVVWIVCLISEPENCVCCWNRSNFLLERFPQVHHWNQSNHTSSYSMIFVTGKKHMKNKYVSDNIYIYIHIYIYILYIYTIFVSGKNGKEDYSYHPPGNPIDSSASRRSGSAGITKQRSLGTVERCELHPVVTIGNYETLVR